MQLGHGKRQHRIWTAETDRRAIAEGIARDKDLTKTPAHRPSACRCRADRGQRRRGLGGRRGIGLPVVVKPSDGNHAAA